MKSFSTKSARNAGLLSARIQRDLPESPSLIRGLRDIQTYDKHRNQHAQAFSWLPSRSI